MGCLSSDEGHDGSSVSRWPRGIRASETSQWLKEVAGGRAESGIWPDVAPVRGGQAANVQEEGPLWEGRSAGLGSSHTGGSYGPHSPSVFEVEGT